MRARSIGQHAKTPPELNLEFLDCVISVSLADIAPPRLRLCLHGRNHALDGAERWQQPTAKGLSDEKAARMMAALREGPRALGLDAPRAPRSISPMTWNDDVQFGPPTPKKCDPFADLGLRRVKPRQRPDRAVEHEIFRAFLNSISTLNSALPSSP